MNVEKRSIEFIPEAERHGSVRNLFNIWFSSNMQVTAVVTGALAVVFGLNLFWSIVAIVLGNLVGGLFMAFHSAQGPKLGIPQMIQSRAQFGVIGAIIPLILVILMYIGFFASSDVLGAQALKASFSMPMSAGLILLSILTFIVTVFGYDMIHALEKYLSVLFAIVFVIVTIKVCMLPLPAGSWAVGHFNLSTFLLTVSVVATWQIAYAPYVADYSRYLPTNTYPSQTFWYTYGGSVIASGWMMILGSLSATTIPKFLDNSSSGLANLFGGARWLMYIVIVLGIIAVNVMNLYGAFMSTTTTFGPFTRLRSTPRARFWMVLVVAIVATLLAIWGQGRFLDNFENFLLFLLYFLVPWTAINLVDFYWLRHGEYSIPDIFVLDGKYGRFNVVTITTYLISVIVEVPFINASFYEGPVAKTLGGADIAWIIGLIVPAILYYYWMGAKLKPSGSANGLSQGR